jgi:hypothetical protein
MPSSNGSSSGVRATSSARTDRYAKIVASAGRHLAVPGGTCPACARRFPQRDGATSMNSTPAGSFTRETPLASNSWTTAA